MTTRAAIYARFSNEDRQNARSLDDQVAVCTRSAEARGWIVVATFTDAGISGEALANRPGLKSALACAEAAAFDVLMTESEDRIARNLEHLSHVWNRLSDRGLILATLDQERVQLMHVAMKGYFGQQWVAEHSQKTSRGMRSNAEKGMATGSRLYGYRSQPGGALEIVEEEANVVREIFESYVRGASGRDIASALNQRGIKGPHGGQWNASTILGSPKRGNGILRTELYAGVKVWNRFDMKKDRQTGKRISLAIPQAEWKRTPVPAAQVLDPHVWGCAQGLLAERAQHRPYTLRRYNGMFSGLLKCGCCGAGFTVFSREWLRCAGRRERGPAACGNTFTVTRGQVERRILAGLQAQLLHPDAVKAYVEEYRRAWADERRAQIADRLPLERRLAVLERQASRLVDAIADGIAPTDVRERFKAIEAERVQLGAKLEEIAGTAADHTVVLHPNAAGVYRKSIQDLQAATVAGSRPEKSMVDAVRDLVARVEITPNPASGDGFDLVVEGRIAALLDGGQPVYAQGAHELVAGGRIELPT